MRTLFKAVAVGALAIGFAGCSQDTTGPDVGPQFAGWGHIQRDTGVVTQVQAPEGVNQCAWDAILFADGQIPEKPKCSKK